ncbi:alpha/beta hydrolase [Proteus sp. ZN5]|uniref:alpha/beta fold hydrolase n=1 Tax=Proteus sp. ZN5 TaxID=2697019 RepID=UPI0013E1403E|nr:alpha/beta hydrolase [Proteus sp. ZN5]QIG06703.1 alpha/beta fold hydrolase [Proteus sp. ZN5]
MTHFDHQQGKSFLIDNAEIYIETLGDPKNYPVILLHGGMGNLTSFNPLVDYLKSYYLIAIDSRGHGKSTLGDISLTYQQLQSDVETVIKAFEFKKCALIGHSDGGIVALRLAAKNISTINKVITIGASWQLTDDDPAKEIYQKITSEYWRHNFPQECEYYQNINSKPDFEHLFNQVQMMWLDQSTTGYPNEKIKDIHYPVLVCRGDNDMLVSLSHSPEIVNNIESASLLNVPFTSHVVHEEKPQWLANIFNDFLNNLNKS